MAVPIIMKVKDKKLDLSDGDLCLVNGFFNIYSTALLGNRPAVFQNMRLNRCRQQITRRELANSHTYMLKKKIGSCLEYKRNIRRTPAAGEEDWSFLNSNDRRVYNPSGDLKTTLERHGVEVMTCNDSRHIITTMVVHLSSI